MNCPRISIIVPSLNQGRFIEAALRSALDQNYPNLELIVMDAGSADETRDILSRLGPQLSHWESVPDRGQSHAINKGLARMTGDVWSYLNTDDLLCPGSLARIAGAFRDPSVEWVGAVSAIIDRDSPRGTVTPEEPASLKEVITPWDRSVEHVFPCSNVCFMRRSIYERLGGFDETYHYSMDMEYYTRALFAGHKLTRIPDVLGHWRWHPASKTVRDGQAYRFLEEELRIATTYADRLPPRDSEQVKREVARSRRSFLVRRALHSKPDDSPAGRLLRLLAEAVRHPSLLWFRPWLGAVKRAVTDRASLARNPQSPPSPRVSPARAGDSGDSLVIAVPVFNAEEFLRDTLESLNAQGARLRWWLQDGGSKDRTVEIARALARDGDVVTSAPDQGQADALNRAFRQMGGQVVGFLNGDDMLTPGTAGRVLDYFRDHPDTDLIYGGVEWVDRDGNSTGRHAGQIGSLPEMLDIYNVWWRQRQWVQPEVFFRRSLWEKVNGFDTRWDLAFDYDFWVRCIRAGARTAHLPDVFARFRIHSAQKSSASERAADEIRAIVRSHLDAGAPIGAWKRMALRAYLSYDIYQLGKSAAPGKRPPDFASALLCHPQWLLCDPVRKRIQAALARFVRLPRHPVS
jgi:glycosyltransferase involved in cell wall biosynthesis